MRAVRKKLEALLLMLMIVIIVYSCVSLLTSKPQKPNPLEERRRLYQELQEKKRKEQEEREKRREEEREKRREEERKEEKKEERKEEKKEERKEEKKEERKEEKKETKPKEEKKEKLIQNAVWVNEIEVYSRSKVDMEAMEEEMKKRKRRVEERCGEVLTEEEKKKEINSKEFLISNKYKLIWCNIFKSASSTWMYNYLLMAGRTKEEIQKLKASPVEDARRFYPRPSPEELLRYLGKAGEGTVDGVEGESYLSFIIVREPFQRLLSAYRDKIEKDVLYYKSLRCKIVLGEEKPKWRGSPCSPTFPQFVDYILKVEEEGGRHDEHWTPYYRFCSPCQAHFDIILRFESLQTDEAYLLEKVWGLSQVVSPKVMHSSHANYTTLVAQYYSQLTPKQMLGLVKMYQPDFWLFGYNERPYLDLVV